MENENSKVIEGTFGSDRSTQDGDNRSPSDSNKDGRSIEVGDIIEGTPDKREFASFPRFTAGTVSDSATAGATPERKKRGPKPGWKRAAGVTSAAAQKNLDGIEKLLLSINAGVAMLTNLPELQWEESEAKDVSTAMQDVARHYDKVIDPKTMAWLNLIGTIGWIEGTRIIAIRARLKEERQKQQPIPISPPQPEAIRIMKPNGAPVPGATMDAPKTNGKGMKPSELDPFAYTTNPIRE